MNRMHVTKDDDRGSAEVGDDVPGSIPANSIKYVKMVIVL